MCKCADFLDEPEFWKYKKKLAFLTGVALRQCDTLRQKVRQLRHKQPDW
jgi:hypothetical protein